MKTLTAISLLSLVAALPLAAAEWRDLGEYTVRSRITLAGDRVTPVTTKPLKLKVATDGEFVEITTVGEEDSTTRYRIYRSDGIGRQPEPGGPLEIIPGVQAISDAGGVHRHLRLTREALTITAFPAISDRTLVTHAVAASPAKPATSR